MDNKLKQFYERCDKVWPDHNKWYEYTQKQISRFVCQNIDEGKILNAGSGGNTYGLPHELCHVDIIENKISRYNNYVISNIEKLPFSDETFDSVICVGSVLNYCSLQKAIQELYRVVKKKGKMILEYESSFSFEFICKDFYKKDDVIVKLEYMGEKNEQHLYAPSYFKSNLDKCGIKIIDQKSFHILSSLMCNIIHNDNVLGYLGYADNVSQYIHLLNRHAGNVIMLCEK